MYPINARAIDSMAKLIEHYLERQKLVALAMLEIHPGPLQMCGTHILGIKIEPYIVVWQDKIHADAAYFRNWQTGIWRGEWKHWAHGHGCRLTNLSTGEPIEWDAPDLHSFDEGWFWNHLYWRIQMNAPEEYRAPYEEWLNSVYQYMKQEHIITLNENYSWILNR